MKAASLLLVLAAAPAWAQSAGAQSTVTVTAQRVAMAPRIDGRFDDDVYRALTPFSEIIQQELQEGAPASERTELWVMFDDKNIYFGVKCYDRKIGRAHV